MTYKSTAVSIVFLLVAATGAAAQERGSQSDQAACEPDVHRLCDQFIPDETQIVACLKSERKRLSPACAKVIARP